jgi:hypothetical protein
MAYSTYNNAKKIFDFFMEKASEDTFNTDAVWAQQYANLKLMKYRTQSIKNALESYKIEAN